MILNIHKLLFSCPECIPSAAIKYSVLNLCLYDSLNTTFANGAPLPGSLIMFLTTPLIIFFFFFLI